AEVEAAITAELPLAPAWLQQTDPNYWERARPRRLLERVVENIGQVDRQADRDRIANLARRAGITTPSFQVVASVLAHFVSKGMRLVRAAAVRPPHTIVWGGGPGPAAPPPPAVPPPPATPPSPAAPPSPSALSPRFSGGVLCWQRPAVSLGRVELL